MGGGGAPEGDGDGGQGEEGKMAESRGRVLGVVLGVVVAIAGLTGCSTLGADVRKLDAKVHALDVARQKEMLYLAEYAAGNITLQDCIFLCQRARDAEVMGEMEVDAGEGTE